MTLSLRKISKSAFAAVLCLFIGCLLSADGWAAETTPERPQTFEEIIGEISPGAGVLRLSLRDCIAAALTNNLDIQIEGYSPRINEADVQSQKGVFDPYFYFNTTYFHGTIPLPTSVSIATGGLTAVKVHQWIITGGLAGALPTGLYYDANVLSEHTPFSTVTDFFQTDGEQRLQTSLTFTQPLLKNFGIGTNTTGIKIAARSKEASVYQFEQKLYETVFAVETAYWELVFAYENLRVKRRSLELAQNLLDENRIRLEVGVLPPLAVLQSETGVVLREEELIVAQNEIQNAKDRLIRVSNLFPDELVWDVEIVPVDEPLVIPPSEYAEGDQISMALKNRPELKQLFKQREIAELGSRFAKNQLLPALDITGSVGLVGLDDDFDETLKHFALMGPKPHKGLSPAFDDLSSGENFQWMIGFTFEIPWGRRYEKGQYRAANLQVSQADAGIQSLRQVIVQDIRNALRGVDTTWQRVVSTRETTRFRQESLVAEKKKFDVGVSTAHDLLKFEEELAKARASEERAKIDYTLSLSNLLRANATLLQIRNVQLDIDS